jgi:hypothetical protein
MTTGLRYCLCALDFIDAVWFSIDAHIRLDVVKEPAAEKEALFVAGHGQPTTGNSGRWDLSVSPSGQVMVSRPRLTLCSEQEA